MISLHTAILRFFIYLNTIMKTDSFLAQRLACRAHNPKVGGSIPPKATVEEVVTIFFIKVVTGD